MLHLHLSQPISWPSAVLHRLPILHAAVRASTAATYAAITAGAAAATVVAAAISTATAAAAIAAATVPTRGSTDVPAAHLQPTHRWGQRHAHSLVQRALPRMRPGGNCES